jgi:hypothetical protein
VGSESGSGESAGTACSDSFNAVSNLTSGQAFQPGENIQVVWDITNTGNCTWGAGYSLKLLGGEIPSAPDTTPLTSTVAPGESITLTAEMQAPSQPGAYVAVWKMQDSQGHIFGRGSPPDSPLRVAIKVIPAGSQGSNPTSTPVPNPTQAPEENPDMLISGSGQTLLDGECFDLNSGSVVDCGDSTADIRYIYYDFSRRDSRRQDPGQVRHQTGRHRPR